MATPHPPVTPSSPSPQHHRRSKTALLKSKLSPHKKTASTDMSSTPMHPSSFVTPVERASNPLNDYMRNPNLPPQIPSVGALGRNGIHRSPKLDNGEFFDPMTLEPPKAPFVADHEMEKRGRRMHKKSLSTMSFSSSRKDKGSGNATREASPTPGRLGRGSLDFGERIRDLVAVSRGASRPPSPEKAATGSGNGKSSSASSKMKKSKSAIDIGILRRKEKSPEKVNRSKDKGKENLTPLNGVMGRARGSSDVLSTVIRDGAGLDLSMFGGSGGSNGSGPERIIPWGRRKHTGSHTSSEGTKTPSPIDDPYSSNESSRRQSARSSIQEHELTRRYTPEYSGSGRQLPPPYEARLVEPTPRKSMDLDRSRGRSTKPKPRPKSLFMPKSSATTAMTPPQRPSMEHRRSNDSNLKPLPEPPVNGKEKTVNGVTRTAGLDLDGINAAFEKLLDSRDVPENRKDVMRDLPISVKQEFVRGGMQIDKFSTDAPPASPSGVLGLNFFKKSKPKNEVRSKSRGADSSSRSASPHKRTRPLSKSFSAHMDVLVPGSPTKKAKSDKIIHLPLSNGVHNNGPPSPAISVAYSPEEWVSWLKEAGRRRNFGQRMFVEDLTSSTHDLELGMKDVNKDKLHKLRLVLRNEALRWIEAFLNVGGMESLWAVIERVLGVEWREDHEDALYHELLLCLKGLCTTSLALQKLAEMASLIFPRLLTNLFDEDKKGPAEFTTRGIIISLLFMHLSTAPTSSRPLRARRILTWLANKPPTPARRPLDLEIFHSISSAHLHRDTDPVPYTPRPYQNWTKELSNTTKEVFWIFLHSANIIPLLPSSSTSSSSYASRHFPLPRPPQPAAAHVGGVEWEATTYIAAHVDLANACIACLVSSEERNEVRREMRNSGWEKVLGGALRLIKDGLHGEAVHDGLRTWVRAASEDGWETVGVRCGVRERRGRERDEGLGAPRLEVDVGRDRGCGEVWEY